MLAALANVVAMSTHKRQKSLYSPALSARRATLKSEVILRTADAARRIARFRRGGSYRGSALGCSTRYPALLCSRGEHKQMAPTGFPPKTSE